MPVSVKDVLKQTGMTDEQINALDAKVLSGFETVVTSANQQLEQAQLAQRAQQEQYSNEIAPALDAWASEKANLEAQAAFYRTQAEKAKEGGFIPAEAPGFTPANSQQRNQDGTFVSGRNEVPGSPQLVKQVMSEAGVAVASMMDLNFKYQQLFGQPMPDLPTVIIKEAAAQHMEPIAYAQKKYGFSEKQAEIDKANRQKEIDAAVKDAVSAKEKELTEKYGSNPMVRPAESSRFSELRSAVQEGKRPDPLMMTHEQRHASTSRAIQEEVSTSGAQ